MLPYSAVMKAQTARVQCATKLCCKLQMAQVHQLLFCYKDEGTSALWYLKGS